MNNTVGNMETNGVGAAVSSTSSSSAANVTISRKSSSCIKANAQELDDTLNCNNDQQQGRRGSSSSSSSNNASSLKARRSFNATIDDRRHNPGRATHGTGDEEENQLSINKTYKIPILGYEVMEERAKFTVFKLRVENEQLNESWLVFRRYTDFERLYAKLKEEYPLLAINLPPKRWLRDNFETAFLEDRMKGLQAFVDSILLRHKLTQSTTVREFFCLDDPPLHSENGEEGLGHSLLDENKLANTLCAKQNEIDVLKTELLLMKTQHENLLRLTKNCSHCNIQQRKSLTLSPPSNHSANDSSLPPSGFNTPTKKPESAAIATKTSTKNKSRSGMSTNSSKLSSSSSSSTSTSYSEIPTALKLSNHNDPKPKRHSLNTSHAVSTSVNINMNHPLAPPRKPRKLVSSTPLSSAAAILTTSAASSNTSDSILNNPCSIKASTSNSSKSQIADGVDEKR